MKKLVYLTVLVFALAGSAFAQSAFDSNATDFIKSAINVGGVEITKGTYDNAENKFWSNTFALHGDNQEFSYHSTISMDYIYTKSATFSEISGGHWSLGVFKEGIYIGMVYGDIAGGFITWDVDKSGVPVSRFTTVKVRVLGGTGDFANIGHGMVGGSFMAYSEAATKIPKVKATFDLTF